MSNETSSFKQVWPLIINEIKHTLEDISSNDIQILVQNLIKAKNIFADVTSDVLEGPELNIVFCVIFIIILAPSR